VALHALQCRVRSRERVIRIRGVVEVDVGPIRRIVAGFARSGKRRGGMVGIGRALPVRLMAAVARRRQRRVVVICVALRARHRRMRSHQREDRRVIERG